MPGEEPLVVANGTPRDSTGGAPNEPGNHLPGAGAQSGACMQNLPNAGQSSGTPDGAGDSPFNCPGGGVSPLAGGAPNIDDSHAQNLPNAGAGDNLASNPKARRTLNPEANLTSKKQTTRTQVFRLFGAKKEQIDEFLSRILPEIAPEALVVTEENCYDAKVTFLLPETLSPVREQALFSAFTGEFREQIYGSSDRTLAEMLVSLLKTRGKVLSVAESFTGGNLSAAVVSVPGASEIFYEGIVAYDSRAKQNRLAVSGATLQTHGAVSRETAFEMAHGLLAMGNCDFALSTTGLAGPGGDGSDTLPGTFFVAAGRNKPGMLPEIRIFRYYAEGNRAFVTQTGVNAALYHAIKLVGEEDF